MAKKPDELKTAVIGLGYVGLPLLVEFARTRKMIGFDIDESRILDLRNNIDTTGEVSPSEFEHLSNVKLTAQEEDLAEAKIYIVTVPTPVNDAKQPNLEPLIEACKTIGKYLTKNNIVIFESTVFPGCTEDICVPVLERTSNLKYNEEFFCGYSPERINPGDKSRSIRDIVKITSGSNPTTAKIVRDIYASIIKAGVHEVSSIRVAEAAKVIENSQRDINIAFVNELAILFDRLDINVHEVLTAAKTKWNFLDFQPGLVGGHCIGVDPYYLAYKAEQIGYFPEILLAGRRINDAMAIYTTQRLINQMIIKKIDVGQARILILGYSFKENCSDVRNTKVYDICTQLAKLKIRVDVFDPVVERSAVEKLFGIKLIDRIEEKSYDGVLIAVGHSEFVRRGSEWVESFRKDEGVIYDFKNIFPEKEYFLR